jgi:hypothetical protein
MPAAPKRALEDKKSSKGATTQKILRARKRKSEWSQHKREKGCCPRHGKPVSRLGHCHACRPQESNIFTQGTSPHKPGFVPRPGNRLDSCFYCEHCGRYYHQGSTYLYRASTRARMAIEEIEHPSGCKFLTSRRHPGPDKRMTKCDVICANREQGEHIFVSYVRYKDLVAYRGLCPEHLRAFVDPRKKIKDEDFDSLRILFSHANDKGVPIFYKVCGHTRLAPRNSALAYIHELRVRRGHGRGVCQECIRNPAMLAERIRQTVEGNGQKNGDAEKRQVGRPSSNLKETLADIQKVLASLKAEGRLNSSVKANHVASLLNIGGATGGDAMMRRVTKDRKGIKGIKITWPALRDFLWNGGSVEQLE